jgi:hypothetical protein
VFVSLFIDPLTDWAAIDGVGLLDTTSSAGSGRGLAEAAGPMGQYITAAGLVVETALGTTRALVGESIEIRKAQFSFTERKID